MRALLGLSITAREAVGVRRLARQKVRAVGVGLAGLVRSARRGVLMSRAVRDVGRGGHLAFALCVPGLPAAAEKKKKRLFSLQLFLIL